jgi:hypothetical protein
MWLFNAESRQTTEHYTRIIEHLRCLRLKIEFSLLILNPQIRKRAAKLCECESHAATSSQLGSLVTLLASLLIFLQSSPHQLSFPHTFP